MEKTINLGLASYNGKDVVVASILEDEDGNHIAVIADVGEFRREILDSEHKMTIYSYDSDPETKLD